MGERGYGARAEDGKQAGAEPGEGVGARMGTVVERRRLQGRVQDRTESNAVWGRRLPPFPHLPPC